VQLTKTWKLYVANVHKIYRTATNIPTSSIARPYKTYPNRDFWFENIPSGNPARPSIFSDSFFLSPPVNRDGRHHLAGAMAPDFSVTWPCRPCLGFAPGVKFINLFPRWPKKEHYA
jgi:hypothetical protein